MSFLHTLLAFLTAIGVLVVFHEFGHYIVARWCGVKVLRFSVGFGKTVWMRRLGRDGTEWAVAAIPLGGFVKMLDEREGEVAPEEAHRAFNRQSVGKRFAIVAAGPLFNLFLAAFFYWVVFILGQPGLKPVLAPPPPATLAAIAGLQANDEIRSVDGRPVQTWEQVRFALLEAATSGRPLTLDVARGEGAVTKALLPMQELKKDEVDENLMERVGLSPVVPVVDRTVGVVVPGSPAEKAGLQPGDRILAVNAHPVSDWEEVIRVIRVSPGQSLRFDIERQGRRQELTVIPNAEQAGGAVIGKIGAGPLIDEDLRARLTVTVRESPLAALPLAVQKTGEMTWFSFKMIGQLLTGNASLKNVSGPITIADYAGQTAKIGLVAYLSFLAVVSLSLGVMNLLPVPILDGGHLLYYIVEVIKGSPVSEKAMLVGQQIGMAMLLLLMMFAFYNDILRLMSGL